MEPPGSRDFIYLYPHDDDGPYTDISMSAITASFLLKGEHISWPIEFLRRTFLDFESEQLGRSSTLSQMPGPEANRAQQYSRWVNEVRHVQQWQKAPFCLLIPVNRRRVSHLGVPKRARTRCNWTAPIAPLRGCIPPCLQFPVNRAWRADPLP